MGAARILIIAVAFMAAIGLAFVVRGMMIGKPVKAIPLPAAQASAPQVPLVRVLVAKHDLEVGAHIVAEDMTWQSMPKLGINTNYITDGDVAATPASAPGKVAAAGTQ
ncbi:MAG: pilus assembly protein CpaB, partial [Verrucomicrobia bacterium]